MRITDPEQLALLAEMSRLAKGISEEVVNPNLTTDDLDDLSEALNRLASGTRSIMNAALHSDR